MREGEKGRACKRKRGSRGELRPRGCGVGEGEKVGAIQGVGSMRNDLNLSIRNEECSTLFINYRIDVI